MSLNLEQLQARRIALMLDYQLIVGHLQEVDHWIEQCDKAASAMEAASEPDTLPEPDGVST